MNQTRLFLIIAWFSVATLLWMEWGKDQAAPPVPVESAMATTSTVPRASGAATTAAEPSVPTTPAAMSAAPVPTTRAAADPVTVTVTTDVLEVVLAGGELRQADLLKYPGTSAADSPPVRLFDADPGRYFVAQSGWVSNAGPAPSHEAGFVPDIAATGSDAFVLADGAARVVVPFVWTGANGVTIRRTYTFKRGDYVVDVRDEVVNAGTAPWQGFVYRQLSRVPRALVSKGPMSAESYSFQGAAWFSATDKYEKRKFDDFVDDGPLNKESTGGWIGMLQHHFFAAWIPGKTDSSTFSLATPQGPAGTQYLIREVGPGVSVAPGATASTQARLWVGPKLVKRIEVQNVPGLDRAVDFSTYAIFATIAGWLFWVLERIHGLTGNWGWAIIGLVILIKAAMYPLSAAQYKSMAKMRKFQPRIAQLKERYGEDRQQFQTAMMELYKKEKINPMGGCLPILVQMPVFIALYYVLQASAEMRGAPWVGWITDLTARDPYFILPAINMAVMWFTQKLTPQAPGMDPMQQKMMQMMPLVFGVLFAFAPAGLVLYWISNAGLGLLQQWWMTKRYAEPVPAKAG